MPHYQNEQTECNCNVCDVRITSGIVIFIPPKNITVTYEALLKTTNSIIANSFLKANESLFEAFCPRCWMHKIVFYVGSDDSIPDVKKLTLIDSHISECTEGLAKNILHTWIGVPEFN
jgi:hypothetical protein